MGVGYYYSRRQRGGISPSTPSSGQTSQLTFQCSKNLVRTSLDTSGHDVTSPALHLFVIVSIGGGGGTPVPSWSIGSQWRTATAALSDLFNQK